MMLSARTMKQGSAAARWSALAVGAVTVLAIAAGCSKDSEAAPSSKEAPGAANGAAAAGPGAGPRVDGKTFTIVFAQSGDCKAGAECVATLKLDALGDYHINKEYPYKFKADGAGLEFLGKDAAGKNVFSKGAGDFTIDGEKAATMNVRFKAAKAGSSTITGQYKMSVCSAQNCQLETQEMALNVAVK